MKETNFDTKKSGDSLDGEHINMNSIRKESPDANILSQDKYVVNNYDMQNSENDALENELNFARENATNGIEESENDTKKMKLAKRVMRALNERYGINFKIYSGSEDSFINGFYENGTVYINQNAEKPILSVIGHEFLHGFKDIDAEGFSLLKSRTESDLSLKDYNRYKKDLLNDYKENGIDISELSESKLNDKILEEAMSDMMGEIINDPETIRKIALEDKNLAERIMAYLGEFIDKIRSLFSENDAEIQSLVHNYEQLKAVYQEVVAQSDGKFDENATTSGDSATYLSTSSKSLDAGIDEGYNENVIHSVYTDEVMFSSRYNAITNSQDMRELYNSAKKGKVGAAYELLSQLLTKDDINKIKSLGSNVHLLPVVGGEGTSTNVLPPTIAKYISVETGQSIFEGIYKDNSSDSRRISVWDRMKENYPSFVIDQSANIKTSDIDGKTFVLIDDNSTTGRTFVGLKNFIEENGGKVVGYYALTTGQDQSEKMVTTDETWDEVLSIGIETVRDFAEKEGVKREISKRGLTERESQALVSQIRSKKADTRRGGEDGARSSRGGREIRAVYETEKKDGSTGERSRIENNFEKGNKTEDGLSPSSLNSSGVKLSVRKGSRAEKAQTAMAIYEESGNVADLPARSWTREFDRASRNTEKMLENQIATAEWEKRYAKTDEHKSRLNKVLEDLRRKQEDNVANVRISGELIGKIEGSIERNYNLADIIDDLKDVDKGLKIRSGNYRFNDFYRNFERVFGKHFDKIKPLIDDFDNALGNEARYRVGKLAEEHSYIVKELGIKKGSKESKAPL